MFVVNLMKRHNFKDLLSLLLLVITIIIMEVDNRNLEWCSKITAIIFDKWTKQRNVRRGVCRRFPRHDRKEVERLQNVRRRIRCVRNDDLGQWAECKMMLFQQKNWPWLFLAREIKVWEKKYTKENTRVDHWVRGIEAGIKDILGRLPRKDMVEMEVAQPVPASLQGATKSEKGPSWYRILFGLRRIDDVESTLSVKIYDHLFYFLKIER